MRGGGGAAAASAGAKNTAIATSNAAARAGARANARIARSAVLADGEPSPFFMRASDIMETRRSSLHRGRGYNARGATALFTFGLLVVLWSCGSRTELWMNDPCGNEGAEQACDGVCGSGITRCTDGFWSPCEVPDAKRACKNTCGDGYQECTKEQWGECVVPFSERPCKGTCGDGIQACTEGAWGTCEVAPMFSACKNVCGDGTQKCEDGIFGPCEVPPVAVPCESVCGPGFERCERGTWSPCDAPQPNPPVLAGVVRDFRIAHPDFEMDGTPGSEKGIVMEALGPDGKPVYRGGNNVQHSTTNGDNFSQWYNDLPGVNARTEIDLQLEPSPRRAGFFIFSDTSFFPIDDELFGNEGNDHNFHFTLETHATFKYIGGETFRFTGDDDMWVFVNRRLAIDLGGLHAPESAEVSLDTLAGTHDLVVGEIYPLDFFFAERHTVQSNFTIETSIADVGSCP
jgi:fibro-slime domain-containing protein